MKNGENIQLNTKKAFMFMLAFLVSMDIDMDMNIHAVIYSHELMLQCKMTVA